MTVTGRPTKLQLIQPDRLQITWDDGTVQSLGIAQLRDACPCATCREKRTATSAPQPGELPVLSIAETQPLKIVHMKPVGNYAYGIHFSDGHDTGIFTLETLRQLGERDKNDG